MSHHHHSHSHPHNHAEEHHSHDHDSGHFAAAAKKHLAEAGGGFGRLGELAVRLCSIMQDHQPETQLRLLLQFINIDAEDNEDAPSEFIKDRIALLQDTHQTDGIIIENNRRDVFQKISIAEASNHMKNGAKTAADSMRVYKMFIAAAPGENSRHSAFILACLLFDKIPGAGPQGEEFAERFPDTLMQQAKDLLEIHRKNRLTPVALLAECGDESLASMVGAILQAGSHGTAILLDGLASSVAAALACAMDASVASSLIATHITKEPGHREMLQFLGLEPILDLGIANGNCIGALLSLPVIDTAANLLLE